MFNKKKKKINIDTMMEYSTSIKKKLFYMK